MMTKVKLQGKIINIVTHQYRSGLYVCFYDEHNNMIEQVGLYNTDETEFHQNLKNKIKE